MPDDDDDIPEARVINQEPEEEEKPRYDPRADFMKGFAEGRPEEPVYVEHANSLLKRIEELEKRVERLERDVFGD